jgi:hypothetical protein
MPPPSFSPTANRVPLRTQQQTRHELLKGGPCASLELVLQQPRRKGPVAGRGMSSAVSANCNTDAKHS